MNGKIVDGFKILRGAKQGDALSCILLLMRIEPLLRNIEANLNIKALGSNELGRLLKVYSFADDVNATVENDPETLHSIFVLFLLNMNPEQKSQN